MAKVARGVARGRKNAHEQKKSHQQKKKTITDINYNGVYKVLLERYLAS